MADNVEMIPVDNQDVAEAVFSGWEAGKGLQTLAREFALPVRQIEEILDRMLPVFNVSSQLRAFKRELRRLEDLSGEFFTIAKRDKDTEAAHLCARLNERICAMRGFSPVNIRVGVDPLAAEVASQPKSYDKIREAIFAVARGQPEDGDGAAGAPGDDEPGR